MTFCCAEKAFKLLAQFGAFWRNFDFVENRKFCPIFVAKSAPKGSCRKPLFCSLFAPKASHFYSKMVGSRCIFMFWRNFDFFGVENNLNLN